MRVWSLWWEDNPQKESETHSSSAWEIPWTEKLGGLVQGFAEESDPTEQLNNNKYTIYIAVQVGSTHFCLNLGSIISLNTEQIFRFL